MREGRPRRGVLARAGARGLVGAMAMTGFRQVTTGLGLLDRTPPAEMVAEEAPGLLRSLAAGHERAAVELAHWSYGTMAGTAFGLLPGRWRRSSAAGPVYGLAIWLAFELAIAPLLGVRVTGRRNVVGHLTLAADHVLYGIVVAGQLAPEPDRATGGEPAGGAGWDDVEVEVDMRSAATPPGPGGSP